MYGPNADVVIIGGSHGGSEAAFRIRQGGFSGSIALLSAEAYLPYHRPPLSKAFLSGEVGLDSLLLRNAAAYEKANVAWRPSTTVIAIDRVDRKLALADGSHLNYGKLILATGGRPRVLPLPGANLGSIHTIRTIADVERLRPDMLPGKRLIIVGAGYIGLEVAAVAVKSGLEVEIIEFAGRVLARVAGPALSSFYERVHLEAGVKFHLHTGVQGFVPGDHDGTRVGAVRCSDGTDLPADLVLVAAGLVPNVELAQEAGLVMANGIEVDEYCQSSDPDILAIGDCVEFPLPHAGRRVRLESVPNALEHARVAASVINKTPSSYTAIPWFWSDQYHFKLQSVGLTQGFDVEIKRPARTPDGFVVFYLKDGIVLAADCVNSTAEFNVAKRLVAAKHKTDLVKLADPAIELKSLLPAKV
jgi:3-phenylpropionate/trans-cinnamate dioxygenase ferredoxin reductase subunit